MPQINSADKMGMFDPRNAPTKWYDDAPWHALFEAVLQIRQPEGAYLLRAELRADTRFSHSNRPVGTNRWGPRVKSEQPGKTARSERQGSVIALQMLVGAWVGAAAGVSGGESSRLPRPSSHGRLRSCGKSKIATSSRASDLIGCYIKLSRLSLRSLSLSALPRHYYYMYTDVTPFSSILH